MLVLDRHDHFEHMLQHLGRGTHRVDAAHNRLRIEVEHRPRLVVIDLETLADDFFVGVVDAVFLERAAAHARHHRLDVGALEMQHREDLEMLVEMLGLVDIAGNAVKNQQIDIGLVDRKHRLRVHVLPPHFDGESVGHQFAARRVGHEFLSELRRHVE